MDIYPPSEDTHLILEAMLKLLSPDMYVLDMGTGSGILALKAKEKGANVTAVDINPNAVKHVKNLGINAIESDLFSNVRGKFDMIVFNPPYLELAENELRGEPIETALHGGKRGREVLDRFLNEAPRYLKDNGIILFLQAESNGVEATESLLNKLGFNYEIIAKKYVSMEGWLLVFKAWRK